MTARAGLYSGSRAVEAAPIGSRSSRVPEAIAGRRRSRARCRPHRCADAGAGHARRTDCEHNGSHAAQPRHVRAWRTRACSPGRIWLRSRFRSAGIGAGCIGLGGRGQLRDWEIFNRPDQGKAPNYAFPSIRVETAGRKPFVSVLEARLQPPYQGSFGIGSHSAPGLQRLQGATFTGEFPLAHVAFRDRRLPVSVSLDAFSPFIPHEEDDSGLPVAVLRYTVTNRQSSRARVSIAYSIENLMLTGGSSAVNPDPRVNERRSEGPVSGILHAEPRDADGPSAGRDAGTLGDRVQRRARVDGLRAGRARAGGPARCTSGTTSRRTASSGPIPRIPGQWLPSACSTISRPARRRLTRSSSRGTSPIARPIAAGGTRRKARAEASSATSTARASRTRGTRRATRRRTSHGLESRTRLFAEAFRESTLPAAVKDGATANLSTLVTQTAFRTADGEFHGFEGCGDDSGCCIGNCTHVWNYETATQHLFPGFARSLRRAAFGYSMDDDGGMRFRQLLPDGFDRFPTAAADGQMGQIMKVYLDWQLVGRSRVPRGALAAREARDRVCLDPGRLGRRSRRRARRRAAQHLRHRVLRAEPALRHLLPRRPSRRRGDGAAPWATRRRAPRCGGSSSRAAPGSTRTCSTASTTSSR